MITRLTTRGGKDGGIIRGGVRPRFKKLRHLPEPLPAPEIGPQRARVDSYRYQADLEGGIQELAKAYRDNVGPRPQINHTLRDPLTEHWVMVLSQAVAVLVPANLGSYVTFVCERYKKLTGILPTPRKVFYKDALAKWIPVYCSRGTDVLPTMTYRQTSLRRHEYEERFHRGRPERPRQTTVPLHPGLPARVDAPPAVGPPPAVADRGPRKA